MTWGRSWGYPAPFLLAVLQQTRVLVLHKSSERTTNGRNRAGRVVVVCSMERCEHGGWAADCGPCREAHLGSLAPGELAAFEAVVSLCMKYEDGIDSFRERVRNLNRKLRPFEEELSSLERTLNRRGGAINRGIVLRSDVGDVRRRMRELESRIQAMKDESRLAAEAAGDSQEQTAVLLNEIADLGGNTTEAWREARHRIEVRGG